MSNEVFVLMLGAALGLIFWWGFRTLPGEEWQFLGTVPREKQDGGAWRGVNFTYYGVFNATACVIAVAIVLVLLGAVEVGSWQILLMIAGVFVVCLPAAKIVARMVEGKTGTLTIGGASFVGMVTAPGVIWAIAAVAGAGSEDALQLGPALAALALAYAFGEGVGRLACISFGCCYGKPLSEYPRLVGMLCARAHFSFKGKTKKIAYAHGLEGVSVLPVQAMTCILYSGTGLIGTYLFLNGYYRTAFLGVIGVSQMWRFVSEFLRSDYRGQGKVSVYQYMSMALMVYGVVVSQLVFGRAPVAEPELLRGIQSLWDPAVIICLQCLWLTVFLYTGRSVVTEAVVSFHVRSDKV